MPTLAEPKLDVLEQERWQTRVDLAAAHRLAVMHDFHEGVDNHFTAAVPGRGHNFYLNAFGLHWSEVTAGNLLELNPQGQVVGGQGIPDLSAICIHAPIHRAGHEVVLHTHMPYLTAISQLEDMTIEMTGQAALYFVDKIAYDYDYNGFADVQAEGERMAGVLGGRSVLVMANHGVVVTGRTVAQAWHRLYFLERAARTQLFSMWTGQRRRWVPDAIVQKVREQARTPDPALEMSGSDYMFAAYKRLLDRKEPDYAH